MVSRVLLPALVVLCTASSVLADTHASGVITVGDWSLSASDVSRALSRVAPDARRALGSTDGQAAVALAEGSLSRDLLFADHARQHLPGAKDVRRDALVGALLEQLAAEAAQQTFRPENVSAYYEQHRHEFEQPQALRLWRVRLPNAEAAAALIKAAAGAKGREVWRESARAESTDEATRYRSGDLGFVYPDGNTTVSQVRVDAALYAAAERVKDGEIVPAPVVEGDAFAVVWRRGTRRAVSVSPEAARHAILRALQHQAFAKARTELLARLRSNAVSEYAPEWLGQLPPDKDEPQPVLVGERPAPLLPKTAAPAPEMTERGYR